MDAARRYRVRRVMEYTPRDYETFGRILVAALQNQVSESAVAAHYNAWLPMLVGLLFLPNRISST